MKAAKRLAKKAGSENTETNPLETKVLFVAMPSRKSPAYQPHRTPQQWKALRRVNDLTRIYRDQFPNGLPHNGLGFKYAKYMCRTKAFDPIDTREQWLDRYAPWLIGTPERAKLLSMGPYWYSPRSLGEHLELYDEDRERLQPWTIEAFDISPEQREQINLDKDRRRQEQKRRESGAKTRQQYLAEVKGAEPWKDEGVSRATWYRRRKSAVRRGSSEPLLLNDTMDLSHAVAEPPATPAAAPEQAEMLLAASVDTDDDTQIESAQPSVTAAVSSCDDVTSPCTVPTNSLVSCARRNRGRRHHVRSDSVPAARYQHVALDRGRILPTPRRGRLRTQGDSGQHRTHETSGRIA
jgi:hypothetical protein